MVAFSSTDSALPDTYSDGGYISVSALQAIKHTINDSKHTFNDCKHFSRCRYNVLPGDIKQETNYNKFCSHVKTFLMKKAKDSLN